jgi:cysteine desulfurase
MHLTNLKLRLETAIRARASGAVIYGGGESRLPNTTCFGVPGLSAETTVIALDLAGVAVSAGSACSSGKVRASHVLTAMGATPEAASEAIRVSTGPATTEDEIDHFIEAWSAHLRRATHRLRAVAS